MFIMSMLLALFLVISPTEQSYGPYSRPERGTQQALAVGSNGTLLAWSENSEAPRIRIALLDSRAQLISGIATLSLATDGAEAYAPAVAFNGESFLVAWIERYRGGERISSVVVDGSGTPVSPVRTHGFVHTEDVTPLIVWDGAAWQVLEGRATYAAATKNGVFATAQWKATSLFSPCGIRICPVRAYRWDVAWTAGDKSGTEQVGDEWPVGKMGTPPPGSLDIAPAGNDFAVAWATSLGIGYLFTSSTRSNTIPAFVDDDVAPGLACDDEHCLIAFGTRSGDVQAIVVETGEVHNVELLTITATARKEHSPRVHSLSAGRFLVSYLSDQTAADQRINGRIVDLAPPARRRAVR